MKMQLTDGRRQEISVKPDSSFLPVVNSDALHHRQSIKKKLGLHADFIGLLVCVNSCFRNAYYFILLIIDMCVVYGHVTMGGYVDWHHGTHVQVIELLPGVSFDHLHCCVGSLLYLPHHILYRSWSTSFRPTLWS